MSDGNDTGAGSSAQTIEVEVDGQMQRLTMDELKKGYLRQAEFTRKTQQLASERSEFEKERSDSRAGAQLWQDFQSRPVETHERITRILIENGSIPDPAAASQQQSGEPEDDGSGNTSQEPPARRDFRPTATDPAMARRLAELEQRQARSDQANALAAERARNPFDSITDDQVYAHLSANPGRLTDAAMAYRDLAFEEMRERAEANAAAADGRQRAASQAPMSKRDTQGAGASSDEPDPIAEADDWTTALTLARERQLAGTL